jgi:hypothetical protein
MDEHGRMVGMPKEIHQLNREYDEVIHEPEKTYHTQSTLDAQTGKGIQLIAKRREFCDKYALEVGSFCNIFDCRLGIADM